MNYAKDKIIISRITSIQDSDQVKLKIADFSVSAASAMLQMLRF